MSGTTEETLKLKFLFDQYKNFVEWYKQAESKSFFVHALNGGLIGLVNLLVVFGIIPHYSLTIIFSSLIISLTAGVVCLILSYYFLLSSVRGRHHIKDLKQLKKHRIWFFGDVQEHSADEWERNLTDIDIFQIESTMISQNHILAGNLNEKFQLINRAIHWTVGALISFLLFGISSFYLKII